MSITTSASGWWTGHGSITRAGFSGGLCNFASHVFVDYRRAEGAATEPAEGAGEGSARAQRAGGLSLWAAPLVLCPSTTLEKPDSCDVKGFQDPAPCIAVLADLRRQCRYPSHARLLRISSAAAQTPCAVSLAGVKTRGSIQKNVLNQTPSCCLSLSGL